MFLMVFKDTEFPEYEPKLETIIAPFDKEYLILCQGEGPNLPPFKILVEWINEFDTPLTQLVITESSYPLPRPIFSNALTDYVDYYSRKKNSNSFKSSVYIYQVEQLLVHLFSQRNWNSEKDPIPFQIWDLMYELNLEISSEEFDLSDVVLDKKLPLVKESVIGRMPIYSGEEKNYLYILYVKSKPSRQGYHETVQEL